jgi:F-type H+-transporting ATPase subunit delta
MKISPKKYAKALYSITKDGKKDEVKGILAGFVELLNENHDLGKVEKVMNEFNKFWNEKEGIIEAEIVSAMELNKATFKDLNNFIAELSGAKRVETKETVDKKILGGVVLKFGDKVVDVSVKSRLYNLRNSIK